MTRNRPLLIAGAVVLVLVGIVAAAAFMPRTPSPGDADGDGRYQYATWGIPGADGAPTTIRLFVGSKHRGDESVTVDIAVRGRKLGSFASSGPGVLESMFAGLVREDPLIIWDLSTFPPGTKFVFIARYEDANNVEIDTETFETTRPAK